MRLSGMTMAICCPWNRTLKDKFMAAPSIWPDRKGHRDVPSVHGTGYDIWRWEWWEGFAPVSEVHSMQDGVPHGYEWWMDADQRSLDHERHWSEGKYHGIERRWNHQRKLHRGYPKYWIRGEAVTKRQYLKAAKSDKTLPRFRAER